LVTPADAGTSIHFADLERGLGLLPVRQREALLLVTAQGLSYEEAAAVMDCALGTAKSRVARARVALVEFLEGREPAAAPAKGAEQPSAGRVPPPL
jgi:RNA polymerase sigma-70 factor (ECF subfamily)